MTAVAHASPGDIRRLVAVRTGPSLRAAPVRVSATTYRLRRTVALLVVVTSVAALVLVLHALLAPFGGGPLTASERPGAPGAVYVVQPGDTFWGIAHRLHPEDDPRPLVARMVAAHGSPVLVPGERLRLPG
jgi:hypothetical protein